MHLITGTGVGGAETMLFKLMSTMDRSRFHNIVYSMMEPGPTADRIRSVGVEVHTLGMKQGRPDPRAILLFAKAVRGWSPHVVQTWMYHADFLGGLVGKLIVPVPVVWNIRHTDLHPEAAQWMTRRIAEICGLLSGSIPARIVCCAESGRIAHVRLGYRASKMIVIPNGFDLDTYRPRSDAAIVCHERFGVPAHRDLISLIARYHPQKDHATFVAAAQRCIARLPQTLFALCGEGITSDNEELLKLIRRAGLEDRIFLLGRLASADIALIMARSSVVTSSSSSGEGFPNVIGEAMACGTLCVVTDIGDSAYIVGDTGIVVASRSPDELAKGWITVLEMDEKSRSSLQEAARGRVEASFSLPAVAGRYENLYQELVGEHAPS
ncbi:MAG: glycosyltransferase [Bryobacteraceae bacterium]|jgi:glycosyltransferase involved in cell wall biosynthesis